MKLWKKQKKLDRSNEEEPGKPYSESQLYATMSRKFGWTREAFLDSTQRECYSIILAEAEEKIAEALAVQDAQKGVTRDPDPRDF